jgi:hypothetical protein
VVLACTQLFVKIEHQKKNLNGRVQAMVPAFLTPAPPHTTMEFRNAAAAG